MVLKIKENDANKRLDNFLMKALSGMNKPLLYKYLRKKRIKVNNKKAEPSYKLFEGDEIELFIPSEFFDPASKKDRLTVKSPVLNIVYEDENILLVNKAVGVSCHPDSVQKDNTLIDNILSHLIISGFYDPLDELSFVPALCNRIDRNTSGLVICAKNASSLRLVNECIKDRRIKKEYIALVHGTLTKKEGTLKHYLKKDSEKNTVFVYDSPKSGALTAISEYKVLKENGKISLVKILLKTGRTHQIRAQFSHIGHPLVGDGKYGKTSNKLQYGFKYQALFAQSLVFEFDEKSELSYLNGRTFFAEPDEKFFVQFTQ